MAILIALYGPQQVGKTTAAQSLCERSGFTHLAFADPIYRMLGALMGLSVADMRKLPKSTPLPDLGKQTLRFAMQTLGTEWGRETIADDLWVRTAEREILNRLKSGQNVVVDDMRFVNEYETLDRLNCKFVRLERADLPEQLNPEHASETAWGSFHCHATVLNPPNGTDNWAQRAGAAILAALQLSGDLPAPSALG